MVMIYMLILLNPLLESATHKLMLRYFSWLHFLRLDNWWEVCSGLNLWGKGGRPGLGIHTAGKTILLGDGHIDDC